MHKDIIDLPAFLADPHTEGVRICRIVPDTDDYDGISQALRQHPSLHFYALSRYRAARATESKEKWLYEQAKRQAYFRLRQEGVGVSDAKEQAELDKTVIQAFLKALDAEETSGRWYSLVKGLEEKGSSLQQISTRQKEELKKNWLSHRDPTPQE